MLHHARKVIALLSLLSMVAIAGRVNQTPTDVALNSPAVQNYLRQGFTIDNVTSNQAVYVVEPTGNRVWGYVSVEMHGKTGGPYSLETTYATVDAYIDVKVVKGKETYVLNHTEVSEYTVY